MNELALKWESCRVGCAGCMRPMSRRRFAVALALGGATGAAGLAQAQGQTQDGVRGDVGKTSGFTRLVSADQVEAAARQQYRQMLQQAQAQRALLPADHPQVVRLRAIGERIIPFTAPWNARARQWQWEINVLGSKELNAFCMPGGKIAFYWGILSQLQLSDDEVATVMGHEVAHALREHARERMGKSAATQVGAGLAASLLGLGNLGHSVLNIGTQLLSLRFSRDDETEADIVGMELAARAGYNPEAGVTLWRKMLAVDRQAPPQWMSTHPAGESRIREIQARLPKVRPLFERAERPSRYWEPPATNRS